MEVPPRMSIKGNDVIFGSCKMSISVGMTSAWLENGTRTCTCNEFVCCLLFWCCCISSLFEDSEGRRWEGRR